jgi:hypothetical protein
MKSIFDFLWFEVNSLSLFAVLVWQLGPDALAQITQSMGAQASAPAVVEEEVRFVINVNFS